MSGNDDTPDTPVTTEMTVQNDQAQMVDWGSNDTVHNGMNIDRVTFTRHDRRR